MTELEKIEYAKSFMDKLANGINPLDDTPIPEGDIVNHVRLSRCFFYVSDILRQIVENGGVTPPPKTPRAGKQAFTITEEARAGLRVTDAPLTVSEIADYLNDTVDETAMKKITAASINSWLVDRGFFGGGGTPRREDTEAAHSRRTGFGYCHRGADGPVWVLYKRAVHRRRPDLCV